MINLFIFLSFFYLLTYIFGHLLEKIHIPWIFSALLLGFGLSFYNPFGDLTSSSIFNFLAQLGMYFMLFNIGLEINLKNMLKRGKEIITSTFFIIFLEAFVGTIFIYYVFQISLFISFLVALSFATVGESILIPILEKYKLVNRPLGNYIIGIGVLDDSIEILALILMTILIGSQAGSQFNITTSLISLGVLFILTLGLTWLSKEGKKFSSTNIESIFILLLFVLFLFIGIGSISDSGPLGALLAGVALKTFLPKERLKFIESEIRTLSYGFFAPIFFLWIGVQINLSNIANAPLIILALIVLTNALKIIGSYIVGRKKLGLQKSIIMGIGLSARFSTSIIIVKILFDNGLINQDLYSVIVTASVIFTLFIPLIFSRLISKWKIVKI